MGRTLFAWIAAGFLFAAVPAAQVSAAYGQEADLDALNKRGHELFEAGQYAAALQVAEQRAVAAERIEAANGKAGPLTADALGVNAAWYALFARRPERALAASERAMTLAPYMLVGETNRAHALLFLGRTQEATAVYIAHKGETVPDYGKWEEVILKDFGELRKRGLDHPDMVRIERALAEAPRSALAQALDEVNALNKQVQQLAGQGNYQEASALAEKTLSLAERVLGKEHPGTLTSVNNLAALFQDLDRLAEAEPLHKRVLEAYERVLGKEHPETLISVSNLALLYKAQGRLAEAEPFFKRALESRERTLGKEHPDTLKSVNNLALLYYAQRRYTEAEPLLKRTLEAHEGVLGKEHPDTLGSLNNLAALYQAQGRLAEAEPLFKRALEAYERVLGKDHPDTLTIAKNFADLCRVQGRYAEAEPLYRRTLDAHERTLGTEHPDTLTSVNGLALLYKAQGRLAEAEPLYRRALEARERVLGNDHPDTLMSVDNIAALYHAQGRYADAEPLFQRALKERERVLGKDHPDTLTSLNNLATLYDVQGRYAEAEPLYRRALEAGEQVQGKEHPETLMSVNNLAALYYTQGRYADAEPLVRRALEAYERVLGKDHPDTLRSVNNLATLYYTQRRYAEAEPLYQRVLEAYERVLGKEHPETLISVNNLAELYRIQFRYAEAEPLCKRALEAQERTLGKEHPDTLRSVNNLAILYQDRGRLAEAEALLKRALEAYERALGKEHPDTLGSVNNLAALYYARHDWSRAAAYWRRSTASLALRTQRGSEEVTAQAPAGKQKSETEQNRWQFTNLVKAVWRLTPEGSTPGAKDAREMFETAQWAQSSKAAASLLQMAVRGASRDVRLAAQVRERQDLLAEWQRRDGLRNTWLGQPADKRNAQAEAENDTRLAAIDTRMKEIDAELAVKFPDYAALATPAPASVEEVQAQLGANEALVFILDTAGWQSAPEDTFIWVVTKTGMRWVRSDLGTTALAREVQALRCGLDGAAWEGKSCADLTGQTYTDADRNAGKPLPFDYIRAHKLYQALFGQVEDLIKGKQLLLVPSGPLTQLPFQVLVTAAPAENDPRQTAWLIREHALTVLPAVSSLKALRRVVRPSAATKPMIGFGNPLLDGPDDRYEERARLARDFRQCPRMGMTRVASALGERGGVAQIETRGGMADIAFIRKLQPLPETAVELCDVARGLNAGGDEIRLGARATEREVKRLSENGQLAQYRIVHFATHGALAGQVRGNAEPGLLLTPPAQASEEDDGYLTASEIAALKLDADWVILSACNTAAGEAREAEALSGLARAFIYAQARALLVSHWEVDSAATVKLITGAMTRFAADKGMGRAEAMRQSMLALIDKGGPGEAEPAFWAPFVVVGEGGTAR